MAKRRKYGGRKKGPYGFYIMTNRGHYAGGSDEFGSSYASVEDAFKAATGYRNRNHITDPCCVHVKKNKTKRIAKTKCYE